MPNEKLFRVAVAGQTYPLRYNLQANMDFDEHFMDTVEDVDFLINAFIGPQDEKGDNKEVRTRKKKERQKAMIFLKRELPWLIATLAKYGLQAAANAGETNLPEPPTAEWIAINAWPGQQQRMIDAFMATFTYGRLVSHDVDKGGAVDKFIEALEQGSAAPAEPEPNAEESSAAPAEPEPNAE